MFRFGKELEQLRKQYTETSQKRLEQDRKTEMLYIPLVRECFTNIKNGKTINKKSSNQSYPLPNTISLY